MISQTSFSKLRAPRCIRYPLAAIFVLLLSACQEKRETEIEAQAADASYFQKLRTTRVESSPIVQWRNIGPGMSGYNEELWPHPTDTDVMFMSPDMHVSYGTWDGGKSWQSLRDHDDLGQEMKRVLDIVFSRQDPNYALSLDWNGWIYETTDKGRSWTKINALSPSHQDLDFDPYDPEAFRKGWYDEQLGARLSTLAVDPANDNIWYVGAGDFWNVKENHRSASKPHGNRLSYADYGYLLKSTDKGRTWQRISDGLPEDLDVGKIIVDPRDPNRLIMAANHGLMLSEDGGQTWSNEPNGLPNNLPRDLTSVYDENTGAFTLFLIDQTAFEKNGNTVTSSGGVYRSQDSGETWTEITGNLAIDLTRISYPEEIARYYRALSHWFGISVPAARKTYPQLPTSILPVFNRIAVHPQNPQEIYLTYNKKHDFTFGPGEVWRSLDGGENWTVVARHGTYWESGKDADYWAERNNPIGVNMQFAHLDRYLARYAEKSGNRLLAINPSGELFISLDQQTLRSTNKGQTWKQIDDDQKKPGSHKWIGRGNSDLPGRVMLLETGRADRRLLASGEHGLWQITGFNDWDGDSPVALEQIEGQRHPEGMVSISTVAVHPNDPDSIYILGWRQAQAGKLRRTADGGQTWGNLATLFVPNTERPRADKVIQGPPGLLPAQNSLVIDPQATNRMYFVATKKAYTEIYRAPRRNPTKGGFGFFRSKDGGQSWEHQSDKSFHDGVSLRRLALDKKNPSTLYVAANDTNGGLYKSADGGDTWARMNIPQSIQVVNDVYIDTATGALYIAAGDFYKGKLEQGGAWRSKDSGASWEKIFESPLVLQIESSPLNPNLLVLNTGSQMRTDPLFLNPGVYLSRDGSRTWDKINSGLGNHDKIVDAKPDPHHQDIVWAASWGSGWHIGKINPASSSD